MSFKRWFAAGLLIVLTASFAASTGVMVVLREREVSRRHVAEDALFQAKRINRRMAAELKSHREKSAHLERDLVALERLNQLTLVRLKGLEKKVSQLEEEVATSHRGKQALSKERQALSNQLMIALSDKKSLKTRLDKMMARSPEEVDLGQIVVNVRPSFEGTVLVVNDKFKFVVVDVGRHEAIDIGTLFNVYRQDQFIGRVQVEQVRESVAACKILPEWTLQDIQEDDRVKEL